VFDQTEVLVMFMRCADKPNGVEQGAGGFITTDDNAANFVELSDCGVHFSPHTLSEQEQRRILGGIVHRELKKAEVALRLQGKLTVGVA